MNKAIAVVIGAILLIVLVLFSTTYTVRFNEVAVRTTFGKTSTASVQTEPGVHFRFPLFADRVSKYDTRVQLAETPLIEVPTRDGQSVVVKAFVMWQIDASDTQRVQAFANSFPDARDADEALRGELQTAVKAGVSRHGFDELIGPDSRLGEAEQGIREQLATVTAKLGVTPVAVGISQVQLPGKTTRAVLNRMQATRQKLAEAERTKGNSEAVRIRSDANSVVSTLRAFAEQRAEELKGVANRKAVEYLREMSEDEELAIFLVQLDTLQKSLNDGTTFILSDEAAPWHLLNQSNLGTGVIPQPSKPYVDAMPETDPGDETTRQGS